MGLTTTLSCFPCCLVATVTMSVWRSTTAPCTTRLQFGSLPSVECWSTYLNKIRISIDFVLSMYTYMLTTSTVLKSTPDSIASASATKRSI